MYSYSVHTYLTTCIAKPQLDKYVTFNITKIYIQVGVVYYTQLILVVIDVVKSYFIIWNMSGYYMYIVFIITV